MIFTHARHSSELNMSEFSLVFNQRGIASSWNSDIIWSYADHKRYRYFNWKFNETN
jgi:hypothetical protein